MTKAGADVEAVYIRLNCCIMYVADETLTAADPPLYIKLVDVLFINNLFA